MRLARIHVAVLSLLAVLAPAGARAQRLVAHDTLSDAAPTAVTCGFCVGEAFGTIFRELEPPLRGIDPGEFPLELREVQIALAAASTTGTAPSYVCAGDAAGGTADVELEVWSGTAPPTGDIRSMPGLAEPWAEDETLLWAGTVSVELSVPEVDGASRFQLTINRLPVVAEDGSPIRIPMPATYVRVVAWLTPGGASTLCDAQALEAPSGVPVRDDDGLVASERSFLHAAGTGWLWSETAGVEGDWGLRLLVVPMGTPIDGGLRDGGALDAAAEADAGALDVDASSVDAGTPEPAAGCGCRAAGTGPSGALLLPGLALLWLRRRRR
jgi:MYXO-CTERM domain-containing protein